MKYNRVYIDEWAWISSFIGHLGKDSSVRVYMWANCRQRESNHFICLLLYIIRNSRLSVSLHNNNTCRHQH